MRAEVRGHHDHGVLEVDGAALAVGHAAVVEHLQQHVEHVRVRLLDLVEQDHAVGLAAHRLGQVAALLVADVARRRADQPRDRVLLHELGHVDADQRAPRCRTGTRPAPCTARSCRRRSGRGTGTSRTGRFGSARPGARAADRVGHEPHRLVLADDALVQRVLHVQQLVALALQHLRHRDAGRARDDLGDLLGADLGAQQLRLASASPARLVGLLQLRLELRKLAVLQLGHLLPVALARRASSISQLELARAPP